MSEGVTLLIIVSMLAAGIVSVIMAERREGSLMSGGDWKQLPMLVACDLLFIGSFCVVLFYLYVENKINPTFVTAGWEIGLLVVVIAYLSFGVRRVWILVLGNRLEKRCADEAATENTRKEDAVKQNAGKKSRKQPEAGGIVAYMQYALIYMAFALLVILAIEILLCSIFPYIDKGQALMIMGVAVNWGDVREQLLGAVLICSLIGFILSTARVGQECVSSGHDQRTDRIEEVKRYLRQ